MIIKHPARRRVARDVARIATIFCGLMLALTAWVAFQGVRQTAYGAVTAGTANVFANGGSSPLTTGGSSTTFVIKPPDGSKCSGDTATNGFKVTTYMVPSSLDPTTLTFNNNGPIVPSGTFGQPLYNASAQSKITNLTTGPGDGLVTGIPPMTLSLYSTVSPTPAGFVALAPGTYNLGIACTLTTSQPYSLDKVWNTQFTITADATDAPGQFTFAVSQGSTSSTTSSTTATTASTTSTTTGSSTTTTSVDGSTTTTLAGGGGGSSSTTDPVSVEGSTVSAISGTPVVSELPRTGTPTARFLFWAILLLVFGRMAILLGRTPKVL